VETNGDGLYAVFGFEQTNKTKKAQSALQAAKAILANLESLNQTYFLTHFGQHMQVGIGIHIGKVVSGAVMIGNEYRPIVMGYPVNIASRIQAATKELNNNLIVSADTYNLVSHTPAIDPKTVLVQGVSTPLTVYLLGYPYRQTKLNAQSLGD
jgi:adenylate cyclase